MKNRMKWPINTCCDDRQQRRLRRIKTAIVLHNINGVMRINGKSVILNKRLNGSKTGTIARSRNKWPCHQSERNNEYNDRKISLHKGTPMRTHRGYLYNNSA